MLTKITSAAVAVVATVASSTAQERTVGFLLQAVDTGTNRWVLRMTDSTGLEWRIRNTSHRGGSSMPFDVPGGAFAVSPTEVIVSGWDSSSDVGRLVRLELVGGAAPHLSVIEQSDLGFIDPDGLGFSGPDGVIFLHDYITRSLQVATFSSATDPLPGAGDFTVIATPSDVPLLTQTLVSIELVGPPEFPEGGVLVSGHEGEVLGDPNSPFRMWHVYRDVAGFWVTRDVSPDLAPPPPKWVFRDARANLHGDVFIGGAVGDYQVVNLDSGLVVASGTSLNDDFFALTAGSAWGDAGDLFQVQALGSGDQASEPEVLNSRWGEPQVGSVVSMTRGLASIGLETGNLDYQLSGQVEFTADAIAAPTTVQAVCWIGVNDGNPVTPNLNTAGQDLQVIRELATALGPQTVLVESRKSTTFSFPLTVPQNPGLVGLEMIFQFAAVDRTAALEVVVSDVFGVVIDAGSLASVARSSSEAASHETSSFARRCWEWTRSSAGR